MPSTKCLHSENQSTETETMDKISRHSPHLRDALLVHLDWWSQNEEYLETQESLPCLEDQGHIGWDCILDGCQEKEWGTICSQNLSWRWTAMLIQKLWEVLWDMWDHCNKELHSSGLEQQEITHSLVNQQITNIFVGRGTCAIMWCAPFLANPKGDGITIPTGIQSSCGWSQLWQHTKNYNIMNLVGT